MEPTMSLLGVAAGVADLTCLADIVTSDFGADFGAALNCGQTDFEDVSCADSSASLTAFAPTNDAFAEVGIEGNNCGNSTFLEGVAGLADILNYHISGVDAPFVPTVDGTFFVETLSTAQMPNYGDVASGSYLSATVTTVDDVTAVTVGADDASVVVSANGLNGVAHVVDAVLIEPELKLTSATAVGAGLTTLAEVLSVLGLVETVDTTAALTIFAPDNAAFEGVNATAPGVDDIVKGHVVAGAIALSDRLPTDPVATFAGEGFDITVTVEDNGDVMVNGAKVIMTNVLTKNAVVHVVDSVLAFDDNSAASFAQAGIVSFALAGVLAAALN